MSIKFCLSCGCEDIIHEGVSSDYHIIGEGYSIDLCDGPFTETPPPNNIPNLPDEPSPEEMGIYNLIGRMMQLELAEV